MNNELEIANEKTGFVEGHWVDANDYGKVQILECLGEDEQGIPKFKVLIPTKPRPPVHMIFRLDQLRFLDQQMETGKPHMIKSMHPKLREKYNEPSCCQEPTFFVQVGGNVFKQKYGVGTKSEHLATMLETDFGVYKLVRVGADPFNDPELDQLVDKYAKFEGNFHEDKFFVREIVK